MYFLLFIILNDIVINTLLVFLLYKLGYIKPMLVISSGVDILEMKFLKYKYIFFSIVFIIEFITILLIRKKLYKIKNLNDNKFILISCHL